MSKPERVFTYQPHNNRRFIPDLCPTCPNFKGTRTCHVHISTVEKDQEILHVHGLIYLDTENPYKRATDCSIKNQYTRVAFHDKRTNKNDDISPMEVLSWMKENISFYGMDKSSYSISSKSFLKIMEAIYLFREGDIDKLVEKHGYLIFNSRQNDFYEEPFNRFTGLGINTGYGVDEKQIIKELKLLSPYAKELKRAIDIAYKYSAFSDNKENANNFIRNFTTFIRSLLVPELELLGYSMEHQSWPYIGNMRTALMEWTGFSDSQLPSVPKGFSKEETKLFDEQKKLFLLNTRKHLTK